MEPPVKVRRDRNAVKKTEKPDANQLVKPKQVKLFLENFSVLLMYLFYLKLHTVENDDSACFLLYKNVSELCVMSCHRYDMSNLCRQ